MQQGSVGRHITLVDDLLKTRNRCRQLNVEDRISGKVPAVSWDYAAAAIKTRGLELHNTAADNHGDDSEPKAALKNHDGPRIRMTSGDEQPFPQFMISFFASFPTIGPRRTSITHIRRPELPDCSH